MMTEASSDIIGRLGKDPEMLSTRNGVRFAKLSVATDHKDSDGRKVTDWWSVTVWKPHDYITELKKGDGIIAKCRMEWDNYEDKDGKKQRALRLSALRVLVLDGGRRGESSGHRGEDGGGRRAAPGPPPPENGYYGTDTDEELPF